MSIQHVLCYLSKEKKAHLISHRLLLVVKKFVLPQDEVAFVPVLPILVTLVQVALQHGQRIDRRALHKEECK